MNNYRKKKLAFIIAVSGDLAFAAGNIAIALNRYMLTSFDLLIYTSEMSIKDKETLENINNCHVKEFSFKPGFIKYMMEHLPKNCRFRDPKKLMRFCHYEAFELLERYENVIWLDADISVQADLSDLLDYRPFGITTDSPWKVRDQFIAPVEGYHMEKDAVCSAVMILDDSLPYQEIYNWLYENTIKYAEYMKNGDQAIINLMLQKFELDLNLMPLEVYQCIDWRKEAIDAKIVHFGTDRKVWNTNIKLNSFPEWYRIHLQWLKMGGSDFKREDIIPENIYYNYNNLLARYEGEKKNVLKCGELSVFYRWVESLKLKKVLVYGHGNIGRQLYDMLDQCDVNLKGFIISDNQKKADNKEVHYLSEVINFYDKEKYMILIGVNISLYEEICSELKKKGINDYILPPSCIFKILVP